MATSELMHTHGFMHTHCFINYSDLVQFAKTKNIILQAMANQKQTLAIDNSDSEVSPTENTEESRKLDEVVKYNSNDSS